MKKHSLEQLQMWAKENKFSRWIYDEDKKPFRKSKKRVDFKKKKRYK